MAVSDQLKRFEIAFVVVWLHFDRQTEALWISNCHYNLFNNNERQREILYMGPHANIVLSAPVRQIFSHDVQATEQSYW